MPRHSETVIMFDGSLIQREIHRQDINTLWIMFDNGIYIVEEAGEYAIPSRKYYRVVRKATLS